MLNFTQRVTQTAKQMNTAILSKLLTHKNKWISLVAIIFLGYQSISADSMLARFGMPSLDTFIMEPRDLLVNRVEAAQEVQSDSAQQFKSALEEFKSVTNFSGGDIEAKYNSLNGTYEQCQEAAQKVTNRVNRVEAAANRLLSEWRDELEDYHDASIKRNAEQQFDQTRLQAEQLLLALRAVERKTEPVLGAFRDQVLFLKHNLNMQAISSLKQTSAEIEQDVTALIGEMEAAIAQAERFIQSMES
ncbi:MAG: DUF2959 domain-containing protein [Acidiferrobacterales bacterium]|nr:DUF2959 domain-containing protein [Acidiferrobacterales bacterium]